MHRSKPDDEKKEVTLDEWLDILHDQWCDRQEEQLLFNLFGKKFLALPENVHIKILQHLHSFADVRAMASANRFFYKLVSNNISVFKRPTATGIVFEDSWDYSGREPEQQYSAHLTGKNGKDKWETSGEIALSGYAEGAGVARWISFAGGCDVGFIKSVFSDDSLRQALDFLSDLREKHKELKAQDVSNPISVLFHRCDFSQVSRNAFAAFIERLAILVENVLFDGDAVEHRYCDSEEQPNDLKTLLQKSDSSIQHMRHLGLRLGARRDGSLAPFVKWCLEKMKLPDRKCVWFHVGGGVALLMQDAVHFYQAFYDHIRDVPLLCQLSVPLTHADEYTKIWRPRVKEIEELATEREIAERQRKKEQLRYTFNLHNTEWDTSYVVMWLERATDNAKEIDWLRGFKELDYLIPDYDEQPICSRDVDFGAVSD